MFLGWYDPDKKRPASDKLADAIVRYQAKFNKAPLTCITNPLDAKELAAEDHPIPIIPVIAEKFIPRHTFYVGQED